MHSPFHQFHQSILNPLPNALNSGADSLSHFLQGINDALLSFVDDVLQPLLPPSDVLALLQTLCVLVEDADGLRSDKRSVVGYKIGGHVVADSLSLPSIPSPHLGVKGILDGLEPGRGVIHEFLGVPDAGL